MAINAKPLEIGRMEGLMSGTLIRHGPDQAVRSKENHCHATDWSLPREQAYGYHPARSRRPFVPAETATALRPCQWVSFIARLWRPGDHLFVTLGVTGGEAFSLQHCARPEGLAFSRVEHPLSWIASTVKRTQIGTGALPRRFPNRRFRSKCTGLSPEHPLVYIAAALPVNDNSFTV